MVDRNLLSSDPPYAGDPDNLLNQLDKANATALGPLYASRSSLVGPGVSPSSARAFTEMTHAGEGQTAAVIGPEGRLSHVTGSADEGGAHAVFLKNNPDAADTHAMVTAYPGSLGVYSEQPLTSAQQRVVNELQARFKRLGAEPDNIQLDVPQ